MEESCIIHSKIDIFHKKIVHYYIFTLSPMNLMCDTLGSITHLANDPICQKNFFIGFSS